MMVGGRVADRSSTLDGPFVVRGCGSIGRRHLSALHAVTGQRALAVPARDERIPELRSAGLDAVSVTALPASVVGAIVATDTERHLEDVASLVRMTDVLCEKPLATNLAEALEARRVAEAAGRRLFCGYCLRFDESLQRFVRKLSEVGRVHSVRIECESYLPSWRPGTDYRNTYAAREGSGGVLRDLSHEIDYALWLFGVPAAVSARLRRTGSLEIASEDSADLFWTVGETAVSIHLDYLGRVPRRRMRASGEHGELEWDGMRQRVIYRRPSIGDEEIGFEEPRDAMYQRQMRAFIAAVRGEPSEPLATALDACRVMAIIDAAEKSSREGVIASVASIAA